MRKFAKSPHLVDYLHKGVVLGAIALTGWGLAISSFRFYSFFTVTKPRRLEAEKKLLAEQEDSEEFKAED